jgi:hypothetical protein
MSHICAHCEDLNNPVTPENGFNFQYRDMPEVEIEMWLHNYCSDAWCLEFYVGGETKQRTQETGLC